jgi:hypothetical protein
MFNSSYIDTFDGCKPKPKPDTPGAGKDPSLFVPKTLADFLCDETPDPEPATAETNPLSFNSSKNSSKFFSQFRLGK